MTAPADPKAAHGWGAMPMRSPVIRSRPWISDTIWIAHESHQLFGHIAALTPTDGWWSLGTDAGLNPQPVDSARKHPDLKAFMADAHRQSQPCVIHHPDYQRVEDKTEAMDMALEGAQLVEAMAEDGTVYRFSHDITEAATALEPSWTWRIRPDHIGATLVAVDRKGRPRFAVKSYEATA